jgi:hypothetical protein
VRCLDYVSFSDPSPAVAVFEGEELRFGREFDNSPAPPERTVQNYTIKDDRVSKRHFRVYSIVYEEKKTRDTQTPQLPPLVYIEDLESSNGTYVNDRLIGISGKERVAHLLCDGDVVGIRPSWKFTFHQSNHKMLFPTSMQFKDMEVCFSFLRYKCQLISPSILMIDSLFLIEYLGAVTMATSTWEQSCPPISKSPARSLIWRQPSRIFQILAPTSPDRERLGGRESRRSENVDKRFF